MTPIKLVYNKSLASKQTTIIGKYTGNNSNILYKNCHFNLSHGCQSCTTVGEFDNSSVRSQHDKDHHEIEKSPLKE